MAYSNSQIDHEDRDQRVREVRLRDHRAAYRCDVAAGDRLALGEVDGGERRCRAPRRGPRVPGRAARRPAAGPAGSAAPCPRCALTASTQATPRRTGSPGVVAADSVPARGPSAIRRMSHTCAPCCWMRSGPSDARHRSARQDRDRPRRIRRRLVEGDQRGPWTVPHRGCKHVVPEQLSEAPVALVGQPEPVLGSPGRTRSPGRPGSARAAARRSWVVPRPSLGSVYRSHPRHPHGRGAVSAMVSPCHRAGAPRRSSRR